MALLQEFDGCLHNGANERGLSAVPEKFRLGGKSFLNDSAPRDRVALPDGLGQNLRFAEFIGPREHGGNAGIDIEEVVGMSMFGGIKVVKGINNS